MLNSTATKSRLKFEFDATRRRASAPGSAIGYDGGGTSRTRKVDRILHEEHSDDDHHGEVEFSSSTSHDTPGDVVKRISSDITGSKQHNVRRHNVGLSSHHAGSSAGSRRRSVHPRVLERRRSLLMRHSIVQRIETANEGKDEKENIIKTHHDDVDAKGLERFHNDDFDDVNNKHDSITSSIKPLDSMNDDDDNLDSELESCDQNTERPWFIISPSNKYRMAWDILIAWLLAYMAFYVPFRVCLWWDDDSNYISPTVFWFETTTDILFGIDILLNFITAYPNRQTKLMIYNPKQIAIHYLKGFFLLDLIATIPFSYLLSGDSSLGVSKWLGKLGKLPKMIKFLRAIRLLKLLRVYKLQQYLLKLETVYNIHHGVTKLIKILIMVMLVTHLVACFWYLMGVTGGDDIYDGGWIHRYGYEAQSRSIRYVASLYWSFSTLTTVGYGDISARTPPEQIYAMLMMLLGVSWYAYVVSSMATIMSSFDAQTKAKRDKMVCVNEFIRGAKLPSNLAKQVRNYFEFKLSNSQRAYLLSNHYDADELLFELSSGLRAEILLHMERDMIQKIPFFKDKVPQFIADTVSMFQPMIFDSGQFIVKEGSQADEMFFISRGSAAIFYGEKHVLTLHEGSYFGEIGCMMGGIRRAGVKAVTKCELQALSRRNLNILLSEYPDIGDELKRVAQDRARTVKKEKKNKKEIEETNNDAAPDSATIHDERVENRTHEAQEKHEILDIEIREKHEKEKKIAHHYHETGGQLSVSTTIDELLSDRMETILQNFHKRRQEETPAP